jgi:2-methylisocitrate lyase-like PEP mutase family enzyme
MTGHLIAEHAKAELLRSLHSGPEMLVLPNAWDAISARIIEAEGFPAIATTSAGVAAVLGYGDGQKIPREEMLFMVRKIAQAVGAPVTADVEAGYGDSLATTHELIAAGAVGMNLEDLAGTEFIPIETQVETIRAIRAAGTEAGVPVVINARTDLFLVKDGDDATRFDRAVERLNAFYDAGADCLFAPGVIDAETIGRLVKAVKGPLNILAMAGCPSLDEMKKLGVRRVSLGSGTSRVALGALRTFARKLKTEGDLSGLSGSITFAEVQKLLSLN